MPFTTRNTPCLWFDGEAERAANCYVSILPNSSVLNVHPLPSGPAEGNAFAEFDLNGYRFTALDGGPMYKLTPAVPFVVSFVVSCESQEEIDHYWHGLLDGCGTPQQYGWLTDRFGLSWQIVPAELGELMERAVGDGQDRPGAAAGGGISGLGLRRPSGRKVLQSAAARFMGSLVRLR